MNRRHKNLPKIFLYEIEVQNSKDYDEWFKVTRPCIKYKLNEITKLSFKKLSFNKIYDWNFRIMKKLLKVHSQL